MQRDILPLPFLKVTLLQCNKMTGVARADYVYDKVFAGLIILNMQPYQETKFNHFSNGHPVPPPYESQKAAENSPLLLQQFHIISFTISFQPQTCLRVWSSADSFFEYTDLLPNLTVTDIFSS